MDFTYDTFVTLLKSYNVRNDAAFTGNIPTFIALAENRLATDFKQKGFEAVVRGTLPTAATMAKPAYWRETIGFWYTDSNGNRQPIRLRSYEYCRNYWPNPSNTGSPQFYADYNFTNFLIVPTPSSAMSFELAYYARLEPLSASNQRNWLTANMPQILLAAVMLEAAMWLKNPQEIAKWQGQYDSHKGNGLAENAERGADRNLVVARP